MSAPITFRPLYKERPWGGRSLEQLYHRCLPPNTPIGESWEIVDRADSQSVVAEGPLAGLTLHDLWLHHRADVFGPATVNHPSPRFPLLVKILDAAETLSLQVHPPPEAATRLGGEPKTELWFVAEARPEASLFVGLKPGVTRPAFEHALHQGTVADLVPRLPVHSGDSIFIPSGRLHAIGAGLVIFEIQQNSDTTYRVFDWNRLGLDGQPRTLHVAESLECIDFTDTTPSLNPPEARTLASCPHFHVQHHPLAPGQPLPGQGFRILAVVTGSLTDGQLHLGPGSCCLLPANLAPHPALTAQSNGAAVLEVRLP